MVFTCGIGLSVPEGGLGPPLAAMAWQRGFSPWGRAVTASLTSSASWRALLGMSKASLLTPCSSDEPCRYHCIKLVQSGDLDLHLTMMIAASVYSRMLHCT